MWFRETLQHLYVRIYHQDSRSPGLKMARMHVGVWWEILFVLVTDFWYKWRVWVFQERTVRLWPKEAKSLEYRQFAMNSFSLKVPQSQLFWGILMGLLSVDFVSKCLIVLVGLVQMYWIKTCFTRLSYTLMAIIISIWRNFIRIFNTITCCQTLLCTSRNLHWWKVTPNLLHIMFPLPVVSALFLFFYWPTPVYLSNLSSNISSLEKSPLTLIESLLMSWELCWAMWIT